MKIFSLRDKNGKILQTTFLSSCFKIIIIILLWGLKSTTSCIRLSWHWKLILSHHRHHTRRNAWRRVRMGPYRDPHVLLLLSAMGINQSISPLARPPLTTSGRSWGRSSDRGDGTSRSISINPLLPPPLQEGGEAR